MTISPASSTSTAVRATPTHVARLLPTNVHVMRTGHVAHVAGTPEWQPETWTDHLANVGQRRRGGAWLTDVIAALGLTGHGGGHFPVSRKWRRALDHSRVDTVVANGAESETLSAKDALLMRLRPHLVIDGLLATAEALGAGKAVVWLHADDVVTVECMQAAIAERRWLDGSDTSVRVVTCPRTYLSGESSAVKGGLSGGPVIPSFDGFQRRRGARAPVTVVHNVETLARIAVAASEWAWGAPTHGTESAATYSRLLTVLTPTDRCVVEAPLSMPVAEVVRLASGRQPPPSCAVLLGGFGGQWAPWVAIAGERVDEAELRAHGWSLGAGVVAPLWEPACGVAETAAVADYLAAESAGQCGPCLFGLPALAKTLRLLRDGRLRRDAVDRLVRDVRAVDGRGACHHPDGAARLSSSLLEAFADDVALHANGHRCENSGRTTLPLPRSVG